MADRLELRGWRVGRNRAVWDYCAPQICVGIIAPVGIVAHRESSVSGIKTKDIIWFGNASFRIVARREIMCYAERKRAVLDCTAQTCGIKTPGKASAGTEISFRTMHSKTVRVRCALLVLLGVTEALCLRQSLSGLCSLACAEAGAATQGLEGRRVSRVVPCFVLPVAGCSLA